jgi:2,3-bisphosphoglycerate-dependent phosphoglycerate mutase
MKPIPQDDAIAPLTGKYLGDLEKVRERIGAVAAQTK